ncbi:partner and localizer of BRCA2 [Anopheles sinensis]|uniref:Partner and localizer of BRCA2 n=1 Tax=Anopheles sinensis TaxID=74873 RepID=A0A084W1U5_ANOSI|nr:partner and localizer of BRCA2 [Anopheles sinensis]
MPRGNHQQICYELGRPADARPRREGGRGPCKTKCDALSIHSGEGDTQTFRKGAGGHLHRTPAIQGQARDGPTGSETDASTGTVAINKFFLLHFRPSRRQSTLTAAVMRKPEREVTGWMCWRDARPTEIRAGGRLTTFRVQKLIAAGSVRWQVASNARHDQLNYLECCRQTRFAYH